jgi:hypothetical protein
VAKYEDLGGIDPYSLPRAEKRELFSKRLGELSRLHSRGCPPYKKILDGFRFSTEAEHALEEFPFLPVRLFKEYEFRSVPEEQVTRTMTSSGTTGQRVSRVFIDSETAAAQMKALTRIASRVLGPKRLPLLVIDSSSVLNDPKSLSARGVGIRGFSVLGRDVTYALNERMELDAERIEPFLAKHEGEDILLFGFTSIIWEHFHARLAALPRKLRLEKGVLIHGGGWKKLADRAVTNEVFKSSLKEACGLQRIHNYYGMVEQTGSIFMEGECGHLHCSVFSDVIVRRPDLSCCGIGEAGIVEVISLLPTSYPGHVLLSEDWGELLGEDDCPCGRLGKYFRIHGRMKDAEIRGCSDTYQSR